MMEVVRRQIRTDYWKDEVEHYIMVLSGYIDETEQET